MKKRNFFYFLLSFLFFFLYVFAKEIAPDCQTYCSNIENYQPPTEQTCFCNPLKDIPNPLNPTQSTLLVKFIDLLLNFFPPLALTLITIAILVGGYFILTSMGDEQKLKSGKKIIVISAICLIFVSLLSSIRDNLIKFLTEIFQ